MATPTNVLLIFFSFIPLSKENQMDRDDWEDSFLSIRRVEATFLFYVLLLKCIWKQLLILKRLNISLFPSKYLASDVSTAWWSTSLWKHLCIHGLLKLVTSHWYIDSDKKEIFTELKRPFNSTLANIFATAVAIWIYLLFISMSFLFMNENLIWFIRCWMELTKKPTHTAIFLWN